jgi:hypothetical protein
MTNKRNLTALELIAGAIGPNSRSENVSAMDLVRGIRMLSELGISDQQISALAHQLMRLS